MNKTELIGAVIEELGPVGGVYANRAQVERALGAFCWVIFSELRAGGEVSLPGLGKLKVKKTVTREGRNPRTGEALTIPARRKAVFTECKSLREALNARN